jgi:hypothetical protein
MNLCRSLLGADEEDEHVAFDDSEVGVSRGMDISDLRGTYALKSAIVTQICPEVALKDFKAALNELDQD